MRYLAAVLAALLLIVGFAGTADAAHGHTSTSSVPVLSVDGSQSGDLPLSRAVSAWNRGLTTFQISQTSSCSGTGCVHVVRLPQGTPTSYCGSTDASGVFHPNYVGCTFGDADGSCTVQVAYYDTSTAWKSPTRDIMLSITEHELGHGLGGENTTPGVTGNLCRGLGHNSSCDSVMQPTAGMCIVNGKPVYVTQPSAADYAAANALY